MCVFAHPVGMALRGRATADAKIAVEKCSFHFLSSSSQCPRQKVRREYDGPGLPPVLVY